MIFASDGFRPKGWNDLKGAVVGYIAATGIEAKSPRLAREHPDVRFMPLDLPSADALIAQVSEGRVDYAVVSSLHAAIARNVHLDFDVAFAVGAQARPRVARRAARRALRDELDAFLAKARSNGRSRASRSATSRTRARCGASMPACSTIACARCCRDYRKLF